MRISDWSSDVCSSDRSRRPGERIPLFVTYYSCAGYLRGGLGDEWPLLPLASSGIAALCVNYYRPSRVNRDAAVDYDIGRVSVETIAEILIDRGLVYRGAIGMGGVRDRESGVEGKSG